MARVPHEPGFEQALAVDAKVGKCPDSGHFCRTVRCRDLAPRLPLIHEVGE